MSHKERMELIEKQGSGGFVLEGVGTLNSEAVEKVQETVDVSEIVAKYDKESVYRNFKGWMDLAIRCICIIFSAFHLYTAAMGPFPPQIQRAVHLAGTMCFWPLPARPSAAILSGTTT